MDKERRKQLKSEHAETRPEAGVYLIVNSKTNKALLGSTRNLPSLRNRVEFARTTGSPGALDGRLAREISEHGMEAFTLQVLESFEPGATMTPAEVLRDLVALEELWREKLDPGSLYA